jgi:hypothetical protein
MPTPPKAKSIEIVSALRTRKTICIHWKQGDGSFDLDERDNPLPSFVKAFDALVPLVPRVLHLPEGWTENLRVIGIRVGDQGGATTVQFVCRKSLSDASKEFPFVTPYRLLSHPTEPGSYTPPLVDADAALVQAAIEEAKAYVRGERAQGVIEFEGDEDDDKEDDGEYSKEEPLIKFAPETEPAAKPKRGRKPKKELVAAAGK